MKNKGFTLVELLGVIALLAVIMLIVYPNVMERIQEKDSDIIDKKKQLVYTAAYDYLYENKNLYPVRAGKVYCVNMGYLSYLDRLPVDDYNDLLVEGTDLSNNYVRVKIGDTDNAYHIITDITSCTDGFINIDGILEV